MEWIRIKDRLPKEEGYYLTRVMDNGCSIFYKVQQFYSKPRILTGMYGDILTNWEKTQWDDYIVTHWMPLPEPPIDDDAE